MHTALETKIYRLKLRPGISGMKSYKTAAWTRSAGKNPKGGLNRAGRASYNHNGHHLKAPVKSGNNPRRASFLARMSHMKASAARSLLAPRPLS